MMRFYWVLLIVSITFLSSLEKARSGCLEHADEMVEKMGAELGVPVSALVRTATQTMAARRAYVATYGERSSWAKKDPRLQLHPHALAQIHFMMDASSVGFPETWTAVVGSHFFPGEEDNLSPNTVAVHDPVGKLNRANQRELKSKNQSSERLGAMARAVQAALMAGDVSVEALQENLFKAWGGKSQKVLGVVSVEDFAKQEVMRGFCNGCTFLSGVLGGMDDAALAEARAELGQRMALSLDFIQESRLTELCHFLMPILLQKGGCLQPGELEAFSQQKDYDSKSLMTLRKRHLTLAMALAVEEEKRAGVSANNSQVLAQLMTFFWGTYDTPAALHSFYQGFFGQDLKWDQIKLGTALPAAHLMALVEGIKADPGSFWAFPPVRQVQVLDFEESRRHFRLPTSGMAVAEGKGSYSDCVESTIRGGILHALRNPLTGEMESDLLPPGPFRDYFVDYAGTHTRLSPDARNAWATLTWQVEKTRRVEGKQGYIPTIENVIFTLQTMMGHDGPVVQPITEETDLDVVHTRYQAFFKEAGFWFSDHLKRPIQFRLEDLSITEKTRTIGSISLHAVTKKGQKTPGQIGYMHVMSHHGDYEQDEFMLGTSVEMEEEPEEEEPDLIDQVVAVGPAPEAVLSLLPWITEGAFSQLPAPVQKVFEENLGMLFGQLNFQQSPQLYVAALEASLRSKTGVDIDRVLQGGFLMNRFCGMDTHLIVPTMLNRLLQSGDPLLQQRAKSVIEHVIMRAPSLLKEPSQEVYDAERIESLFELGVSAQAHDAFQQVGSYVSELCLGSLTGYSVTFWKNLPGCTRFFPYVSSVRLTDTFPLQTFLDKAPEEMVLSVHQIFQSLRSFDAVEQVFFNSIQANSLAFFSLLFPPNLHKITYRTGAISFDDEAPEVREARLLKEETDLQAAFARLKKSGQIAPEVVLEEEKDETYPDTFDEGEGGAAVAAFAE